jgi:TIGR03009 family protein
LQSLNSLSAKVQRTSTDKTFNVVKVYEGTVKRLKPDLAMSEMHEQGKSEISERYVRNGKAFYWYEPENKLVSLFELPLPRLPERSKSNWLNWGLGSFFHYLVDQVFLEFPLALKAEETKRLYHLKLVKEDQYYIYIECLPRTEETALDFKRARLVLNRSTHLPREWWLEQPNGNEIKWDIPEIQENIRVSRDEFINPQIPAGWELRRTPTSKVPE